MIRTYVCPVCEEGKVFTSKYGGLDPDVWFSHWCEECDGKGNLEIDDESIIPADVEIVTKHDRDWYMGDDAKERHRRQWSAEACGCIGYGAYEDGAVRNLFEVIINRNDEMEDNLEEEAA